MARLAVPSITGPDHTFHWNIRAQVRVSVPDRGMTGRPQPERVITMSRIDPSRRQRLKMLVVGLMVGAVAVSATACGGANAGAAAAAPVAEAKTVNIALTGKIDADTGPAGTFTGKDGWPAVAPSDITFAKGDTVELTIKEYDDAPTALPAGSPSRTVAGGTMTVNAVAGTTVSNANIAHTFTIAALGINVPLTKAPTDGVSTTVFTFTVNKAGSYTWSCMTPCGGGANGMTGSMSTKDWMKGNGIVS
jgi:hypothetical protein